MNFANLADWICWPKLAQQAVDLSNSQTVAIAAVVVADTTAFAAAVVAAAFAVVVEVMASAVGAIVVFAAAALQVVAVVLIAESAAVDMGIDDVGFAVGTYADRNIVPELTAAPLLLADY